MALAVSLMTDSIHDRTGSTDAATSLQHRVLEKIREVGTNSTGAYNLLEGYFESVGSKG